MTDWGGLGMGFDDLDAGVAERKSVDPRHRWIERRKRGVACSDLPALWLALGLTTDEESRSVADYIRTQAAAFHDPPSWWRLLDHPPKLVEVARHRESVLLDRWRRRVQSGEADDPAEREVDLETLVHLERHEAVMRLLPVVDRIEPTLLDSTDAVALTREHELVVVQTKCLPGERRSLPWYWQLSTQAEIAVTDAAFGIVVLGEGFARAVTDVDFEAKTVRAFVVRRDEAQHGRIREVARWGWELLTRS